MFRDIIFVVVYQGNVKDWQYWIMWLHFLSSWTSHQKRVFNNRWDVRWITMRRNKSLSFISSLLCSWCKCNVEVLNHLLESGRLGLVALLSNRGWNLIIRYPRLTLVCLTIENYFSSRTKIRHLVSSLLWYEDYHWLSLIINLWVVPTLLSSSETWHVIRPGLFIVKILSQSKSKSKVQVQV